MKRHQFDLLPLMVVVLLASLAVGCADPGQTAPAIPSGTPGEGPFVPVMPDATGSDAPDTRSVAAADVGPAVDVTPDAPTEPETDPEPDPDPDPEPSGGPEMNVGWIGGPCVSDADCDFDGGFCLYEDEGFPQGHCTQECDLYCPDMDGMVTTFCLEPDDMNAPPTLGGLCGMRCKFGPSESGCREGYKCVELPRHDDPGAVYPACVPGHSDGDAVALSACHMEMIARDMSFSLAKDPLDHPSGLPEVTCSIADPVYVDPVMHGVNWRYGDTDGEVKPMFSACELAIALDGTSELLGPQGVTDVVHWGIYSCRVISGTLTLSQHGLANAVDIAMVRLEDGSIYTVYGDWEQGILLPVTEGGSFLSWMANSLFEEAVFNIILTPEYNAAHEDHFHCDLTEGASFLQ